MQGIQWILFYYFCGVPSWSWYDFCSSFNATDIERNYLTVWRSCFKSDVLVILIDLTDWLTKVKEWNVKCCKLCVFCRFYPFHYAPYMSDVRKFSEVEIKFELGTPFLPFEQLLAVLPAASRQLLPKPFQVRYMSWVLINFIILLI